MDLPPFLLPVLSELAMPDFESSPPLTAGEREENYRKEMLPATPSLHRILADRIRQQGPLDFADFMATALYHPDLGYYAGKAQQVGRAGDFFTSVSVGPLFGNFLARRFLREWRELGEPQRWRILECGAHDGSLAADILTALQQLDQQAFDRLEYVISEPLPRLQELQAQRLSDFCDHVVLGSKLEALAADPLPGVVFGNELLDALPFHLVEWRAGKWQSCMVVNGAKGDFSWQLQEITADSELAGALAKLDGDFPEGYRTEVRTGFRDFLEPLTRCISSGLLLWLDYGFARPEYYLPERHQGTLRTFSKHHAGENPLVTPGDIDITAHVDFTAVAEAGLELGCIPRAFRNQGGWLTDCGREWLLAQEGLPDAQLLRQFQTLTHPSHLGGSFHVLEIGWNLAVKMPLPEIDSHRLALFACGRRDSHQ